MEINPKKIADDKLTQQKIREEQIKNELVDYSSGWAYGTLHAAAAATDYSWGGKRFMVVGWYKRSSSMFTNGLLSPVEFIRMIDQGSNGTTITQFGATVISNNAIPANNSSSGLEMTVDKTYQNVYLIPRDFYACMWVAFANTKVHWDGDAETTLIVAWRPDGK